jgi:hypothetical protein
MKALYYDWEKVCKVDPAAERPRFLFNTGQWFGTAGVLTRSDFEPWVEWTMPRRIRRAEFFMPGDQGVLNYVFNRKVLREGLLVERKKIMCWPARSMEGLDIKAVSNGTAVARVVHWAGLKRSRLRDMVGGGLLAYFEDRYYQRLPVRGVRRFAANCQHRATNCIDRMRIGVRLAFNKYRQRIAG